MQPAVLRLTGTGLCSATLVAPNLLLTARHCVQRMRGAGSFECDEAGRLTLPDSGPAFLGAGEWGMPIPLETMSITDGRGGPKVVRSFLSDGGTICESDLALLLLDSSVDEPAILPLQLQRAPAIGDPLQAAGFGQTEDAGSSFALKVRAVTVNEVGPAPERPGVASPVPAGFFSTSEALCRGDSGGPAISSTGAIVGVASQVSRVDLVTFTGTHTDCSGEHARSIYSQLQTHRALIAEAFAAAGAAPWLEGQPDPRAALTAENGPCSEDANCQSNICAAHPDGSRRCGRSCLDRPCAEGSRCSDVAGRKRCVPLPPLPQLQPPPPQRSGCDSTATSHATLLVAAAVLHRLRRLR